MVKRGFDVVVASLLLVGFMPALLIVAAAIKLTSRGPVLFRQQRYGVDARTFWIYKFRTMYVERCDQTGVKQTCPGDERVTPIGAALRRSSVDELPQLINIIRGDMSLVGPRPHVPGMLAAGVPYEMLVANYYDRCRVRPGVTGLAQASGLRGCTVDPVLAKARIDLDLQYIEKWSFMLDLRIIVDTLLTECRNVGKGI